MVPVCLCEGEVVVVAGGASPSLRRGLFNPALPQRGVAFASVGFKRDGGATAAPPTVAEKEAELAEDLKGLYGQLPPCLICEGRDCEIAVLHLLSLPFAGVVFVNPVLETLDHELASGILAVPVLIISTDDCTTIEKRKESNEVGGKKLFFDVDIKRFCEQGPFGCEIERIDEGDRLKKEGRLLELFNRWYDEKF